MHIGFGPFLRRLRQERGLTQRQVARASGLSVEMLSRMEKGERTAWNQPVIARLAQALDVRPEYLSVARRDPSWRGILLRKAELDTQKARQSGTGAVAAHRVTLGSYLKDLRQARGWSLADLGRRTELSPSYLAYLETDREAQPMVVAFEQLARAYDQLLLTFLSDADAAGVKLPAGVALYLKVFYNKDKDHGRYQK